MSRPYRGARPDRVDGNAAGGVLMEAFGRDVTAAEGSCAHCRRVALLADAVAELDDAGVILLCRGCGHTLLTYLRTENAATLALPGLADIRWPLVP
jgi:hypothetical protein